MNLCDLSAAFNFPFDLSPFYCSQIILYKEKKTVQRSRRYLFDLKIAKVLKLMQFIVSKVLRVFFQKWFEGLLVDYKRFKCYFIVD